MVYAHPNPASFNAAMRDAAVDELGRAGHLIELSDLYAMDFDPALRGPELLGDLGAIQGELDKVRRADLLLFQFPDWWYGMPAIMKGWVDRVFAFGFAYDDEHFLERGLLSGKKAMLSMTVGAREEYYRQAPQRGLSRVLEPLHYGIFNYCGMEVLPPFFVYGPGLMDAGERAAALEAYRERLRNVPRMEALRFS
jgi:NAD(P)H dehydrogenase (quinone)